MKQWFVLLCMFLCVSPAFAGGELQVGQDFPGLLLPRPAGQVAIDYLGVPADTKEIGIADIRADLVVVEFFSMYCPHCQHEAPLLNDVYDRIGAEGLGSKVKMIGIGIGNSPYEVDIFKEKFEIEFPLFADEDYLWHGEVGQVGTPYFVFVRLGKGLPKVVFTHLGRVDSAPWLTKKIKKNL
ncbi:peroxiredoxin family protein [Desulfoplanes sp.]